MGVQIQPTTREAQGIACEGTVGYTPNTSKKDKSLKYDISDYVSFPKKIMMEPNTKTVVTSKIQMTDQKISGVRAGGFNFEQDNSSAEKKMKILQINIDM
ncbi:WxL protein peptidoglycan domain-containing protein [Lactococcus formosensis]|uniref:DUF916 domain-containing protein n=1 Tax=Lactococcus formosensis TaxID=1281486 RepID=A0A9Q9D7M1_9LACT|nr:DUF916 domain-containing protein [Lactococcus formosensis]USJ21443.1 DUF916 domain-containing protein [Lactococcus formosensis]